MTFWQSALLRIVLLIAATFVSFLPRSLELRLGSLLGCALLFIKSKRRKIASENIRRCLPELGSGGWRKLLNQNYRHYGILAFELLHMFSPLPHHWARYARKNSVFEGLDHWRAANKKGKGVLFVASHLANWELMAAAGAFCGIPITMVTKHLKPEWLHRKIESSRLSSGVSAAYEPRTLPLIMRALRKGESVGFVLDQYAGPPLGIPVKFFNVEVGTLAAVGTLAQRTGAVVLPTRTYRDLNGIVHVCVEPALEFTDTSEQDITAALAQCVETWVRQHPAQWLWIHRRFKNVVWPNV